MKTHILFMAGYYGTELLMNQKLVWPSALEIIFGRKYLDLPVEGLNDRDTFDYSVGKVVREVKIVGKLYSVGAYANTLNSLAKLNLEIPGLNLDTIPWDWRKDPREGAIAIHEKIKQLKLTAQDRVYIVAHSYGGLALSYYLRYGIQSYETAQETWDGFQNIQKAVLVAVPFRGTMAVLKNTLQGQSRAGNKTILSPRTFSTFPSTYFMLPPQGLDLVLDEHGEEIALNVWDLDNWEKYGWGFFSSTNKVPKPSSHLKRFKEAQLIQADRFQSLMYAPVEKMATSATHSKKVLYLQGGGVPTLERGFWAKDRSLRQNIFFEDGDLKKYAPQLDPKRRFVDGDGTLPTFSTEALPWFAQIQKFDLEHLHVLETPKPMRLITEFLKSENVPASESKTFDVRLPASP